MNSTFAEKVSEELRAIRATVERPNAQPETVLPKTDLGNAERLVANFGEDIRFVHTWGRWIIWDRRRWAIDETGEIQRLAKKTVRSMLCEAADLEDAACKGLTRWAVQSESQTKLSSMVVLAKSEEQIAITHADLDREHFLLNVANGTLNLKTGELQPHDRLDSLTKLSPVKFDPDAACPRWMEFLDTVTGSDAELSGFLQRAVGYTLSGDTSEQCLFFAYGTGANGKSTFTETLAAILGDYHLKAPASMLMAKRDGGGIPNDIARLPGARFVVASELEEGARFAESLVKDLTGGDTMTARFLHQEFFEFSPTHTLWLYGNHRPVVRGCDEGIWRRIHLVPFTIRIPEAERDPRLKDKLAREASGILSWAVAGCLNWQREGLGAPAAVQKATGDYRKESDRLGDFIEERCTIDPAFTAATADIYRAYRDWAEVSGERPVSKVAFGRSLAERGFTMKRTATHRGWTGISVTPVTDE